MLLRTISAIIFLLLSYGASGQHFRQSVNNHFRFSPSENDSCRNTLGISTAAMIYSDHISLPFSNNFSLNYRYLSTEKERKLLHQFELNIHLPVNYSKSYSEEPSFVNYSLLQIEVASEYPYTSILFRLDFKSLDQYEVIFTVWKYVLEVNTTEILPLSDMMCCTYHQMPMASTLAQRFMHLRYSSQNEAMCLIKYTLPKVLAPMRTGFYPSLHTE
jgi:hypothetical protein